MVYKLLLGGNSGDLMNADDQGGYFADIVYVGFDAVEYYYEIATYRDDDLIDLRDANFLNINYVRAGAGNDTVLGGAATDWIADQSGDDRYTMGSGNDLVFAGTGNDTIIGGGGIDQLRFNFLILDSGGSLGSGEVGVTCDLQITTGQNLGIFGTDFLKGFENVEGGNGNDRFFGTAGQNTLNGAGGNDLLRGRGQFDVLQGGNGRDTLIGDGGADNMSPGPIDGARDTVKYFKISDSGIGSQSSVVDRIFLFDFGGTATDDRIDLSAIDARRGTTQNDAFIFRGTGAFSSSDGEIRLQIIGQDTLVHVDIDGDGATEMNIFVSDVTGLTAADFIL